MLSLSAPPWWSQVVAQIFLVAAGSFALGCYTGRRTVTGTVNEFVEDLDSVVDKGKPSKLAELAETEDDFKMVSNPYSSFDSFVALRCKQSPLFLILHAR